MESNDKIPYVLTGKSYTAVAVNAAAKAGEWIRSRQGTYGQLSTKTSGQDLVTEIDKGAEQMIRRLILTHFPDHGILGEESVEPGEEASIQALSEARDEEYLWIIDPIDGTTNFVHGFPFYSVSIALAHNGEVILGVIYDPSRDEMFVAEKGKGAYVHGVRMAVSKEERLAEGLIAVGFPADPVVKLPINLRGIEALAPRARSLRAGGSAALHLAHVAAGRLSGYWEAGLNAWDIAAGALLIAESGGRVSDTLGEAYHLGVRNIVATNGTLHAELLTVLKEADATGV